MDPFSERHQLVSKKPIQMNEMDLALLNRIWNIFYNREYVTDVCLHFNKIGKPEILLDSFGCTYEYPEGQFEVNRNISKLKEHLIDAEWYETYDFIERYVATFESASERRAIEKELNAVLEQEKSGYRMIKGLIVPITNEEELKSLKKSMSTPFNSVNLHFEKAMALYSKRKNPDYENSIKESISAVEAMCCTITGMTGKQATLGNAIKKLKDSSVHIHPAMETAFSSLYGYTSDENGIRHGGIDFKGAPVEDAKYMLISCSAFLNYLIEKWSKVNP